jgi:hypothetical protein
MDHLETHLSNQADRNVDFFWHRVRWKVVASFLPERPVTLLDVGAGAGLVGIYLSRERPADRYDFVEPIASLESDLVARYGADHNRTATGRLDDVEVVTLLDVIEHVEDDTGLLRDLVERTSPGTTFLVTVPAGRAFWSEWDVALGHQRRYDRSDLRAVLERAGLNVVEVSYLFPELVPAAWWRARRPNHGTANDDNAEFPELPRRLDRALLLAGTATARARRWMPTGTSLFAAATR